MSPNPKAGRSTIVVALRGASGRIGPKNWADQTAKPPCSGLVASPLNVAGKPVRLRFFNWVRIAVVRITEALAIGCPRRGARSIGLVTIA